MLGRRVAAGLVDRNYAVVALSRSEANDRLLESLGAEPRRGDLFDPASLRDISHDCDTLLHLATRIPTGSRITPADWLENDHIRTEGTRSLLAAIDPAAPKYVILQSVEFLYGDRKGASIDERSSISTDLLPTVVSASVMERLMLEAIEQGRIKGRILRFGRFYSADSPTTTGMIELIRRGRFPVIGNGAYYWNLIHVDDAASAVIRAVEQRREEEEIVLNINDDEPVGLGELLRFVAGELGVKRPGRVPSWLARLLMGKDVFRFLTESSRISNRRAKEILGWNPRFPDFRSGFREILAQGAKS